MKIAIVAPSPVPFTMGGAENLVLGMQNAINDITSNQCELIKVPILENNFWDLIRSYSNFYNLDLSHFDMVISTKYPSWMVQHHNHVLYMIHTLRGLYDSYHFCNLPEKTPSYLCVGLVKRILDIIYKNDLSSESINAIFENLKLLKETKTEYNSETFSFPGPFIREIIQYFDRFALSGQRIQRYYTMSDTVRRRKDYFPINSEVKIVYPPSKISDFASEGYDYIFTASRLDGPKRLDLIIKAMEYVPHNIKLKIAGTGPEEKQLKKVAQKDGRIEFVGYVNENELISLYSHSLAVLFTPYDEDYGLITLEAMMSKKPVITTFDSGGPTELVQDGKNGFITNPTPQSIAEKINYYIEYPENARIMGNAGYSAVQNISWLNFIKLLLKEEENVLQEKRKVLVLSTYSCYPPRGGGQQRLYNIYSRLAKKYDVTICSIIESNKTFQTLSLDNGLKQICIPQSIEHAQCQWTEEKKLKRNLYDCCMIDFVEKSPQYTTEVRKMMNVSDIIIFSHPYLFPLAKYIGDHSKVIYEAHNVEFLLKSDYVNNKNWDNKLFSNEKECCDFSGLIFTTSAEDKKILLDIYNIASQKIVISPNGVNIQQIQYISSDEKIMQKRQCNLENIDTLLFVGSWHPPNLEALKFIIKNLLPKLDNTKLLLVGSIKDYYLSEFGKFPDTVLPFGVVDELEKYEIYKLADIAINPMFSGSGTNLKMLDYFSAGIPVVTTETGARGLLVENEMETIICAPDNMVQSIKRLIGDKQLQNKIRKNARALAESTYSWDVIVDNFENHLEEDLMQ